MTLVLLALLAQTDPRIEGVERLTGEIHRPLLWCPLVVTISSASGFKGSVEAQGSAGVSYAREITVAPGGKERILLPALDPVEVSAGPARMKLELPAPRGGSLVGVDARVKFAGELVSNERVVYRRIEARDLRELLSQGLMEAFDALVLDEVEGLPLAAFGASGTWTRATERAAAEEFVGALQPGRRPVEAADGPAQRIWDLAPRGGWMPAKRTFTVFFVTVYAFAGFTALAMALRRNARRAPWVVAGVAALFVTAYFAFFPRGRLWITEYSCEAVSTDGKAAEWKLWFAATGNPLETRIEFPRLVKPVFAGMEGKDAPFTIAVGARGCVVEGLRLPRAGAVCFAGVEERSAGLRPDLYRATLMIANRKRPLGDLAAGAALPSEVLEDSPPPRDADFAALGKNLVKGDCVFGWLDPDDRPARDIRSPDLADARVRPRFQVRRLR